MNTLSEQPAALDPTDPNLQQASARMQRVQWVWAGLFLAMALLIYFTMGAAFPFNSIPWLLTALLLLVTLQPAAMAVVAVVWLLSLISIMPGFALVFGPDPISLIFSGGVVETIGRAAIRVVLAITAWNQFMMYRMLYGTQGASGLPPDLPHIPEVIRNYTRYFAWGAVIIGAASLALALASLLPADAQSGLSLVQLGFNLSLLALGAGLGAAFSPSSTRRPALLGLLVAGLAFIACMATGNLLLN
jgi:hypothetical protein